MMATVFFVKFRYVSVIGSVTTFGSCRTSSLASSPTKKWRDTFAGRLAAHVRLTAWRRERYFSLLPEGIAMKSRGEATAGGIIGLRSNTDAARKSSNSRMSQASTGAVSR